MLQNNLQILLLCYLSLTTSSREVSPRTELSDIRRNFEVVVAATKDGPRSKVIVPDISGELWRNAVIENEISSDWMDELKQADAALLLSE